MQHAARPKRTWARRVGVAVGALLFFVVLVVGYLHTPSGQERLRAAVEQRLAARVNGRVHLGAFRFRLFGDVAIGGLSISDEHGDEAIAVKTLRVAPVWGSLLRGKIVLDALELDGVRVHAVKDASGALSLSKLFKAEPPSAPPKEPPPPSKARIELRRLAVSDVEVVVDQPDGSRLRVAEVGLDASVDALPGEKTFAVEVPRIAVSIDVDKGEGALKAGVHGLTTGLTVAMDHGKGKVTLHPLHASVVVTPPGREGRTIPVSLDAVTVDVDDATLKASLEGFAAGALALASIDVASDRDQAGPRHGDALGLHLDAKKLNELLGRDVVASDMDVELHANGKGDGVAVGAVARTAGGTIRIDGSLAGGAAVAPGAAAYDVTIDADGIDTKKLLVDGASTVPSIAVGHARVAVKGNGVTRETATADAKIHLERIKVRDVPIDDVAVDAHIDHGAVTIDAVTVDTLGQHAKVTGGADLEKKTIDVTLAVDGDPGAALGALRAAGVPVQAALPRGAVVVKKGGLVVHAKGRLEGAVNVDVDAPAIEAFGGRVGVVAHAVMEKKQSGADDEKLEVHAIDATVTVNKVELAAIGAARGKALPVDGAISGRLDVSGAASAPETRFAFELQDVRAGVVPLDVKVGVEGHTSARDAHLALAVRQGAEGRALLSATADVPLAGKKIDPHRPLALKIDLPRRPFAELVSIAAVPEFVKRKVPPGELALAVDVHGTAAHPEGKLDLDLRGRFLEDKEQRLHLVGAVASNDRSLEATLDATGWLDDAGPEALVTKLAANAPGPERVREAAWTADVDLRPLRFDSIPLPTERAAKLRALGGEARGHLALHGTLTDVLGDARIEAHGLRPGGGGPLDVATTFALHDSDTAIDAGVDVAGTPIVTARGTVKLGGRGLLSRLEKHEVIDPELAIALDIPKRAVASLASLRASLGNLPGVLDGHVDVAGTALTPLAKGQVAVSAVETVDGERGAVALDLDAGPDAITSDVRIGGSAPAAQPVRIDVRLARAALARFASGEPLPIEASLRAAAVDLRTLTPKALAGAAAAGIRGRLDSDLVVRAALQKKDGAVALASGELVGKLDLADGVVPLPNTSRTFRDVALHLECDAESIRSVELAAVESDRDNSHRSIRVRGHLGLEALHPRQAEVDVHADKWLLFGKTLGHADAPRGTVSMAAHVTADLEHPLKTVDARIKHLEVLIPDRFEKAHQPEVAQVGDVMFVGDAAVAVGKLPVPAAVAARAADGAGAAEPSSAAAPEGNEDEEERGLDATVHIEGARVLQSPIDISPRGALAIRVRPSGRTIRGKLVMTKGELSLGGKMHPLKAGSVVFDDAHPDGWMDLLFSRPVPAAAMPEVAQASAGDSVTIHMFGPLADRKTVLGGAGSPGHLYDLLAMHNAGHVRYLSAPGMPASNTAQFPGLDNVLALSFISVNLPHLLFLDRVGAWADPYDDRKSYGRLEHYEAERYAADGKVLVRATNQPPKMGASQSAVELDYLLQSSKQSRIGVGVGGGSRGGGGPGVFWEWSSKV